MTVTLSEGKKEFKEETIKVPLDSQLEKVMVDHFAAEVKDGMITKIAGHEQNVSKNKYWLFNINDEFSTVAASGYKLQANDKIDWTLESISN